jgi:hypothetical protein
MGIFSLLRATALSGILLIGRIKMEWGRLDAAWKSCSGGQTLHASEDLMFNSSSVRVKEEMDRHKGEVDFGRITEYKLLTFRVLLRGVSLLR